MWEKNKILTVKLIEGSMVKTMIVYFSEIWGDNAIWYIKSKMKVIVCKTQLKKSQYKGEDKMFAHAKRNNSE